jgi:hypothetical protein
MINDFLFGDAHHIVSKRGYEILHKMNMGSIGSKGIEVGSKCIVANPMESKKDLKGKQITISKTFLGSVKDPLVTLELLCIEDTEDGKWFEFELELIK